MKAALVGEAGLSIELDPAQPLVVGRSPKEGRAIDELSLSREHFRLRFDAGRWLIEDLGSTSGTYLNDRLARGATVLEVGDRIRAGRLRFTFEAR